MRKPFGSLRVKMDLGKHRHRGQFVAGGQDIDTVSKHQPPYYLLIPKGESKPLQGRNRTDTSLAKRSVGTIRHHMPPDVIH